MMLSGSPIKTVPPLPVLRQDLRIEKSASQPSGEQSWVIYDPLQHKYIQIDSTTKALLSIWNEGKHIPGLLEVAQKRLGLTVLEADIENLVKFVHRNHLTADEGPSGWRANYQQSQARQQSLVMQLIHNYLYLRIPLLQPNDWLKATLPLVEPLFSRTAAAIILSIGAAGLYLVSRQWEAFLSTFPNFFTLEGAAAFSITLFIVKALHELGHAYTAVRYGCRVATMGLAFMVMVPMLYTDVSDAWRLRDRRERFMIGAAGVVVELALACLATLLWVFMPDGILRSVMFILATTSWIVSVGLNLNPLMRFDGYYLLADAVGIDNLQPRSFALGRWKLREIILAPDLECPEILAPRTRQWMIVYAWLIWLYRLVLFTGIALLVYSYFFKALGIFLFFVEIWFFILRPVVGELAEWSRADFSGMSRLRLGVIAGSVCTLALAIFVPWSTTVYIPAIVEAGDAVHVFPPLAGKIESLSVKPGQRVEKGAELVRLSAADIDNEIARNRTKLEGTMLRLARTMSDPTDREQRLVLIDEYDSLETEHAGLLKEKEELVIRAPISGRVLELDPQLHEGRWISKKNMIAVLGGGGVYTARGYVAEQDAARVTAGSEGVFIPDDILRRKLPVKVSNISEAGAATIEQVSLTSEYGGRIAVQMDSDRRLVPVQSQYQIELAASGEKTGIEEQSVRGVARVSGVAQSIAGRVWKQVGRVLVRESGF